MPGQPNRLPRKGVRAVTWASLVLVPALAVAAVGPALLPALYAGSSEITAPSGLLVAEARAFATPAGIEIPNTAHLATAVKPTA